MQGRRQMLAPLSFGSFAIFCQHRHLYHHPGSGRVNATWSGRQSPAHTLHLLWSVGTLLHLMPAATKKTGHINFIREPDASIGLTLAVVLPAKLTPGMMGCISGEVSVHPVILCHPLANCTCHLSSTEACFWIIVCLTFGNS